MHIKNKKIRSVFLIWLLSTFQCFCFTNSIFAENVTNVASNTKIDLNVEPETRIRATYLKNANRTRGFLGDSIDSVAFVYGREPNCPYPDTYANADEKDGSGLVLHLSLLAYKNQGKYVKIWGDEIVNGIIYEKCKFDENNKSNIVLAIFEESKDQNGHDRLLYKTNLNLIRKENGDVNGFYDLGVDIRNDVLRQIKGKTIAIRFYENDCNANNIEENLLATFCGGTHDDYFEL